LKLFEDCTEGLNFVKQIYGLFRGIFDVGNISVQDRADLQGQAKDAGDACRQRKRINHVDSEILSGTQVVMNEQK
jgi:hypothetical protein